MELAIGHCGVVFFEERGLHCCHLNQERRPSVRPFGGNQQVVGIVASAQRGLDLLELVRSSFQARSGRVSPGVAGLHTSKAPLLGGLAGMQDGGLDPHLLAAESGP